MDNKLRSIKQRRDNQLPTEYISQYEDEGNGQKIMRTAIFSFRYTGLF